MILIAASLAVASVVTGAQWSIVVTRTGHVAGSQVTTVRESLTSNVSAQNVCGLGTYAPPANWATPAESRADLDKCTGRECLEALARDIGVDRVVALRFNEGIERILVATSLVDVLNGTLRDFGVTELSAGGAGKELERLAQKLCALAPEGAELSSPPSQSDPDSESSVEDSASSPGDQPYAKISGAGSKAASIPHAAIDSSMGTSPGGAAAERRPPLLQGALDALLPVSAGVATSGIVLSGVFMSMGAWQNTVVRTGTFHTQADLQTAITFGRIMNTSAYVSAGVALLAAAGGAAAWYFNTPGLAVSLSVAPGDNVHVAIRAEY